MQKQNRPIKASLLKALFRGFGYWCLINRVIFNFLLEGF
ncbi:hypothetical protein OUE_0786 [Helicobacter pylori R030b]|nr:hypothetical protein OUE_0786 [Helicobacter pylori R030b]